RPTVPAPLPSPLTLASLHDALPISELLEELRRRGARVTSVPVYRWALPEDVAPLRNAATAISRGEVDVVMFTTSVQLVHLWQIVDRKSKRLNSSHGSISYAVFCLK